MIRTATRKFRALLDSASLASDLRWRRPPRLTVRPSVTRAPRVYYLSPHLPTPSGGVRNTYRHVDLLNEAGIDAVVLHAKPGFRCTWFANQTTVVSAADAVLGPDDMLVVPECYGPALHLLPDGVRKVLFNQGAYHTFDLVPFDQTKPGAPYIEVPNLVAQLTVSENSEALLRYAFPTLPVHRARVVVDGALFHPPPVPAGRRIAYHPRRRRAEREQVLHMLRTRGVLDGWELVPIQGYTEAQAADLLRGCALFFSFSEREGFGLPPVEAMASGCYVVGFTGLGGREFFDPEFSVAVTEADVLAFAMAAEAAVQAYSADPDEVAKAGRVGSERVLARYHPDLLREDLLAFYGALL